MSRRRPRRAARPSCRPARPARRRRSAPRPEPPRSISAASRASPTCSRPPPRSSRCRAAPGSMRSTLPSASRRTAARGRPRRAARAFALAGHGGDDVQGLTAHERATTAWDVLPVVYANGADTEIGRGSSSASPSGRRGARASGAADRRGAMSLDQVEDTRVDTRPGLANLSARAGEALGSYVSPSMASRRRLVVVVFVVLVLVLVVRRGPPRTVRRAGAGSRRSAGGTARWRRGRDSDLVRGGRAQDARGSHAGVSDGISLAELTLVQAAPPPSQSPRPTAACRAHPRRRHRPRNGRRRSSAARHREARQRRLSTNPGPDGRSSCT